MAGPLRFRTPHIEELHTAHSRHAPGFAWVAVPGGTAPADPSKNWGTTNRKRAGNKIGGQTEQQREAITARQQREVDRRIRELNSDNSKDVQIPIPKKEAGGPSTAGGAPARIGKTTNTKKILASGKTFAHYLDDEEAEIARTGRRDGDLDVAAPAQQRPSKTPIARRKIREGSSISNSPAPSISMAPPPAPRALHTSLSTEAMDIDIEEADDEDDPLPPLPTAAEMEALLDAPPLTYNQARSAPPPPGAPPPRKFCETCGYWGRVKCSRCGVMVCSVECKDTHDQFKCLKIYA
ncbi:Hypothetical protein R9X50_00701000 [Acrodontium crateriforme]|uniref:HIT-type domain-containing protein n=1 Tax=Acrodontium crateriforme TaxID=150365 RepID=A0AAQ3RCH6_9PEZI|nr:Hypothetical protein R9X50_00701000 [Acrodontium crateriforme]